MPKSVVRTGITSCAGDFPDFQTWISRYIFPLLLFLLYLLCLAFPSSAITWNIAALTRSSPP